MYGSVRLYSINVIHRVKGKDARARALAPRYLCDVPLHTLNCLTNVQLSVLEDLFEDTSSSYRTALFSFAFLHSFSRRRFLVTSGPLLLPN